MIEVHDLVKVYDGRPPVLNRVSFSVAMGEFVTIFGRSGCGKTTLLNMLGGLDRPASGSITIDGSELTSLNEDQLAELRLRKIGFVFQDFNLIMDLTVRDNIALPLRFSGRKDKDRVDEMLREFDLRHIASVTPNRISGGEAQRTAVARALMNEPKVILADEPTGNLDNENTEKVIEMFVRARERFGTTIVLATHDLSLGRYSTSKMSLDEGKLSVEVGSDPPV